MRQNLSERILARLQQSEAMRRRRNFAAFLAQRDQIAQSLRDGWAMVQIWETLHHEGRITTGYAAFCKQVKRLIRDRDTPNTFMASTTATPRAKPKAMPVNGFSFDSTPNKEDLL